MTKGLLFAVAISLAVPTGVLSDSWDLPKVTTTESANGQYRFVSKPRGLSSQLGYFRDLLAGRSSAGQDPGAAAVCRGRLEQKTSSGDWETVWERELSNDVAPVTTIVADSGKHTITFDNWHAEGYGSNAVVIYGEDGEIIRAMRLRDFLSEEHFNSLPRTVSSIHWGRDHSFSPDGDTLVLNVVPEGFKKLPRPGTQYEQVRIRLSDGKVLER